MGKNSCPRFFFVRFLRSHYLLMMSTMTEREGKHEQETDSNDRNGGNGRSCIRPSWSRASWRTSFSWRASPSSCSASSSPPSPSPLRMGHRRCGNRNRRYCARYCSPSASCRDASSYGRGTRSCGGSPGSCGRTSACASSGPADDGV